MVNIWMFVNIWKFVNRWEFVDMYMRVRNYMRVRRYMRFLCAWKERYLKYYLKLQITITLNIIKVCKPSQNAVLYIWYMVTEKEEVCEMMRLWISIQ